MLPLRMLTQSRDSHHYWQLSAAAELHDLDWRVKGHDLLSPASRGRKLWHTRSLMEATMW
jgi:hypothetical protein